MSHSTENWSLQRRSPSQSLGLVTEKLNLTQQNTHSPIKRNILQHKISTTGMWANAQRDGHPAEHRWRPLFNAARFGWCSLMDCRAVTLPRCKTRWN